MKAIWGIPRLREGIAVAITQSLIWFDCGVLKKQFLHHSDFTKKKKNRLCHNSLKQRYLQGDKNAFYDTTRPLSMLNDHAKSQLIR